MKFNLATLMSTCLLFGVAAADDNGWTTRLKVDLTNDHDDFNIDACPEESMVDLKSDMHMWIEDELLSIFGQKNHFSLSDLIVTNEEDILAEKIEFEADLECKLCGKKQWGTEKSIHNVVYLIQWVTTMAVEDWRTQHEELLEGCMDEGIHLTVRIEKIEDDGITVFQASGAEFSKNAKNTISLLSQNQ